MPQPQTSDSARSTPPKRRKLLLRFSLRTLLIVMTAVCIFSGLWISKVIHQRTAVRRFYQLTASRARTPGGDQLTTMGYSYGGKDAYYKPIIPKWQHPLRDALGEEAFGEITGVQLLSTAATDDDVRLIAQFPTMKRVSLSQTQVTDQGLRHLRKCKKLQMLTLDQLPITDAGVAQLAALPELDSLSLSGTKITDDSLEHLAKMSNLKELWLRNTAITNDGYLKLQAALPNCQIQADVPAYFKKQQKLYW
jgi:hypothetical protein